MQSLRDWPGGVHWPHAAAKRTCFDDPFAARFSQARSLRSAAMKHWLRAFTFFRPDMSRIVWALVLLIASVAANLLKPWPLAYIIDLFTGQLRPLPSWVDQPRTLIIVGVAAIVI